MAGEQRNPMVVPPKAFLRSPFSTIKCNHITESGIREIDEVL